MPWGDSSGAVVSIPENPEFVTLKTGDIAGGNYLEVQEDGTDVRVGNATQWDEISQSVVGKNLYVNAGRIDYNYDDLTVDFSSNARYPNENIGVVSQMLHARKVDSDIYPHIHWIQEDAGLPNILVEYRWYGNGEPVTATWTQVALTSADNVFVYSGGVMQQITRIILPVGSGIDKGLSSTFEVKIYRDNSNSSGLFSGADSYPTIFKVKYYDIHIEKDTIGSREEFVK